LDSTNIRAATIRTNSDSIRFAITWINSNHIKFVDKTIATRDIKVAVIGVDNNTSLDDYTSVNKALEEQQQTLNITKNWLQIKQIVIQTIV
jgi:hypothetical protein